MTISFVWIAGMSKNSMMTKSKKDSVKSQSATGSKSSTIRWRSTGDAASVGRNNA